ncbi:MAG TPA: pectate lyase [bacterium]|nr:pectate lyase [bacterium]HPG46633.1 pectate lyase [bacterium]HPM98834.1 pectate lyase [bacterium]
MILLQYNQLPGRSNPIALLAGLLLLVLSSSCARPLAFPGAEGYGRFTAGGRGGRVIAVTHLQDSGAGSLRAALEAGGPRTVVFNVSGTIALQSPIMVENGDLTVAGQTAPGDGICVKGYPIILDADNLILRFLRLRLGDENKIADDAISATHQRDIIIDHCSMSWGNDEVASFYDNANFTLQWCLISESLHFSHHPKGPHGYGGIWGGRGASFHHNLLAHHASRTPRFNGSRNHGRPEQEIVDFRNNVIYNWGFNSAYGGEGGRHNIIANFYRAGPATRGDSLRFCIVNPWYDRGCWFVADNFVFGYPNVSLDNWAGGVQPLTKEACRAEQAFPVAPVQTQPAGQAFLLVLENAGAVLPKRDALDRRIVEEVRTGTALYGGQWGAGSGIIDSQSEVGGWPELHSLPAPADRDGDGMPDGWEASRGLNPDDPIDGNLLSGGWTHLEVYLNTLCIDAF